MFVIDAIPRSVHVFNQMLSILQSCKYVFVTFFCNFHLAVIALMFITSCTIYTFLSCGVYAYFPKKTLCTSFLVSTAIV